MEGGEAMGEWSVKTSKGIGGFEEGRGEVECGESKEGEVESKPPCAQALSHPHSPLIFPP